MFVTSPRKFVDQPLSKTPSLVMGLFARTPVWNYDQIPDLQGKTAIVTGGSAGLGKQTCLELARKNCKVYVLGRDATKTTKAIDEIKEKTGNQDVQFLQADLMDLESVSSCADVFLAKNEPLHILVNNAGIMAPPFSLSKNNIESQFATNHFAHVVLTSKLLPKLQESAPSRIVNLSSMAHSFVTKQGIVFENWNDEKQYNAWRRYGESKLLNILFTQSLTELLESRGISNVYVNVAHPGVVKTELTRNSRFFPEWFKPLFQIFQISVEEGALTQTFLATDPSIEKDNIKGKYFVPTAKLSNTSSHGRNETLRKKAWDWTMETLKEKYKETTF